MVRKRKSEFLSKKELAKILNRIGIMLNRIMMLLVFGGILFGTAIMTAAYLISQKEFDFSVVIDMLYIAVFTLYFSSIISVLLKSAVKDILKSKDNVIELTVIYFIGIIMSILFAVSSTSLVAGKITTLVSTVFIVSLFSLAGLFFIANYRIKTFFEVEVEE